MKSLIKQFGKLLECVMKLQPEDIFSECPLSNVSV